MRLAYEGRITYTGDSHRPGRCGLWLYRDPASGDALAVLLQLDDDRGDGVLMSIERIATTVMLRFGLDPARTAWAVRTPYHNGGELFSLVEFTHVAHALINPEIAPSTRAAVETLAGAPLPAPDDTPDAP